MNTRCLANTTKLNITIWSNGYQIQGHGFHYIEEPGCKDFINACLSGKTPENFYSLTGQVLFIVTDNRKFNYHPILQRQSGSTPEIDKTVRLRFQTESGSTFSLKMNPSLTILQLKEKVAQTFKAKSSFQLISSTTNQIINADDITIEELKLSQDMLRINFDSKE